MLVLELVDSAVRMSVDLADDPSVLVDDVVARSA